MLRSGFQFNWQHPKNEKGKIKKAIFLVFNFSFLIFHSVSPAEAATPVLGVVRSAENSAQWEGISRRLGLSGVAYCIVDLPQLKQAADLASTQILFLPNIENLSSAQVQALQEWMAKGGRVIVTGPVGSLSQPQVRTQLQSLLGAYWGFALSTPASLEPVQTMTQGRGKPNGLRGRVHGGVVIPAGLRSQTAAVWKSSENPPAVVTTDKSIFLGWRWGVDTASSVELDTAWLQASLKRYGQSPSAGAPAPNASQQPCNPGTTSPVAQTKPIPRATVAPPTQPQAGIPTWSELAPTPPATPTPSTNPAARANVVQRLVGQPQKFPSQTATAPTQPPLTIPSTDANADGFIAPAGLEVKPGSQLITASQAIVMRQELEDLISRFESAQLAGNAISSTVASQNPLSSSTVSLASIEAQPKLQNSSSALSTQNSALKAAKAGLQKFVQLVNQQNYAEARQQWLQARRLLWDHYPTDRLRSQSEIRAMWLDRGTIIRAGSERELAKIFDRLALAGFNTVFFETVNAGYPIYPSRIAPQQNPLVRGWDPLASAVKLARERGIELHAWVWIFAVGNQRHNTLVKLPASYPGPILEVHPDWAGYDNQGRLFHLGSGKTFLDPSNPEARRYLIQLMEEIVRNYQVDGVQLDYIRQPFQDPKGGYSFGYGKAARQQFQQLTGADPVKISPRDQELWQRWIQFRAQQIDTFVAEASRRLKALRPQLIVSAAVFPFPEQERLQKLQQNWEIWAKRGDVDLLVPMTYALDTNKLQTLTQPWLGRADFGSTLILPSIRLLSLPDVVVIDQIQAVRNFPASGFALFAAENLNSNLQGIFSRTQGRGTQKPDEPLPYRQPFKAVAARYETMQREWNFLTTKNELLMREPALSEWRRQADSLSAALTQLAAEPSAKNLATAKISLNLFQSQFRKWMQLHASEHPYQVQAWENRLAMLEGLLRYGERSLNQ